MLTGPGPTLKIMAGSGSHTPRLLTTIMIGHRIDTVIGPGVRRTAGPGLDMNRGVGLLIITDVGSTTTTTGPGVRAVNTTGIEAGGGLRWSPFI